MSYDSTEDTLNHRDIVQYNIDILTTELHKRGLSHDASKLGVIEKPLFDKYTPELKGLVYGSPEYTKSLEALGVALQHHYKHNPHHPEHHENGMNDMTLVDLMELFCDWCASTMRHETGDIIGSIKFNKGRFGYGDVLENIMLNTARKYGMGAKANEQ
jgi:hypothetical protein